MSCRELVTLFLDDWLEARLPRRRRALLVAHLADCAGCRAYVAGYRAMLAALRVDDPEPRLDEDLVQSLLRAAP